MFRKVLVANRGEIAIRVIRACRELGIETVAVHSEADAGALHVRFAHEAVCIGPAPAAKSYLHVPALISAAEITAADAIHPGYGFLSENAEFAQVVERCGLHFIGPRAEAMQKWGDKLRARALAKQFGLPLLPGSEALENAEHAELEAARVGYPVMVKARGGGGGRGMRVVRNSGEMRRAFESATAEAMNAFRNPELYLERFVERPKHIEFQVLADHHGQVWTLGERECSLQRKNQKLIEEAPSPNISDELRASMSERIRHAVRESGYTSLGTLEFLMDGPDNLYFMEMNTRVQVEHPVTEMTTGVDLVAEQTQRLPPATSSISPTPRAGASAVTPSSAGSWPKIRTPSRPGREDPRVPPARRRRRARRFRRVRRLDRAVALRLAARQGHRPRADPRRGDRPHAALSTSSSSVASAPTSPSKSACSTCASSATAA